MKQQNNSSEEDLGSFVKTLSPKQKIQALLKHSENPNTYGLVLSTIVEEIATNNDLLNEIGREYKEMMRNALVEKLEECRTMRLEAFQAVLNFHFKKLRLP